MRQDRACALRRCIFNESFSSWAFMAVAAALRPSCPAIAAAGYFRARFFSVAISSAVQRREVRFGITRSFSDVAYALKNLFGPEKFPLMGRCGGSDSRQQQR